MKKIITLLLLSAACAKEPAGHTAVTLLNVSYDPTRELYEDCLLYTSRCV